ncbi:MAG TPA: hypothetical protein VF147_11280, partial [Vicinamibacterales bacterium]
MTKDISRAARMLGMAAMAMLLSTGAWAQQTVTSSDIQRLQDEVYQASRDISQMRSGNNSSMAGDLQQQLDEVRDEVVYLKVKLRREGSVSSRDYSDVRDRLQNIRAQA